MKSFRFLFLVLSLTPLLLLAEDFDDYVTLPALPQTAPAPQDNPQTADKIILGKQLYFDTRLSVTGKISCNSCHDLARGGTDHLPLSTGALGRQTRRSTPTVLNAAFQSVQFWDGRAASLEAAIEDHLLDPTIMAMPDETAVADKLKSLPIYPDQFAKVFGPGDALNYANTAKAIASYLRTLITPDSAFDRYVKGDKQAISKQALRGLEEFQSVGCVSCHFGTNISGPPVPMGEGFYELFPNYPGSRYDQKYKLITVDQGRYEVTHDPIHKRLFHMPSLRNIALTAPYFHTGSVPTLEEAVRVMGKTQLDTELTDGQVADIAAFLCSLTGELPEQSHLALP